MGLTWVFSPAIAHFFHIPGAVFVLRGFALALPFDAAAQIPVGRMTRSRASHDGLSLTRC